jgi:hypothetical protein
MNEFEKVVTDIAHVVEWPFKNAVKVIEVIDTAIKQEPIVKSALVGLIQQIGTLTGEAASAIASKGVNITADEAALAAAQALWKYVTATFIPAIDTAYKDEATILDSTVTTVTASVTTTAVNS